MCYDVHELNPLLFHSHYLSFCLLLTPDHTLWLHYCLSFCHFFLLLPSRCNLSLFSFFVFLILSLTSLIICQPSPASSPLYLFLHHLPSPYPFVYLSVSLLHAISLSQQRVCLCFGPAVSCLLLLYTHIHPAHICTSVCMPMTVWRSPPANPKHKGRQGTIGER